MIAGTVPVFVPAAVIVIIFLAWLLVRIRLQIDRGAW